MNMVPSKSEKQIIFRLVWMLDVSTRCIDGRGTFRDFTSTAGGVTAIGAMVVVGCVWRTEFVGLMAETGEGRDES